MIRRMSDGVVLGVVLVGLGAGTSQASFVTFEAADASVAMLMKRREQGYAGGGGRFDYAFGSALPNGDDERGHSSPAESGLRFPGRCQADTAVCTEKCSA